MPVRAALLSVAVRMPPKEQTRSREQSPLRVSRMRWNMEKEEIESEDG